MTLKISIITVCYNSSATIADTIRSVAQQTYKNIEHIIVDGQSNDSTILVVEANLHDRLKFISEPDEGIYDAMNKGLALSDGEVICFLNSDDIYADNEILSKVVKEMMKYSLDAYYGDIVYFKPNAPSRTFRRYRSHRFKPDRIPYGWMPAHPALFMRRWIYERLGGFRTHFKIAGDFDFVARAFTSYNIKYQYSPKIIARMQTGGISNAGLRSKFLLNREVLQSCRENGIKTNMFKLMLKYPQKFLDMVVL